MYTVNMKLEKTFPLTDSLKPYFYIELLKPRSLLYNPEMHSTIDIYIIAHSPSGDIS